MWLTTIPYERDGSALTLLGVAFRALQERGETGMMQLHKERADQPEEAGASPLWRVKASEYATDLKTPRGDGYATALDEREAASLCRGGNGLPISIAREAVREGVEYRIAKYLRNHVAEIAIQNCALNGSQPNEWQHNGARRQPIR